jgi:hypothetical protein
LGETIWFSLLANLLANSFVTSLVKECTELIDRPKVSYIIRFFFLWQESDESRIQHLEMSHFPAPNSRQHCHDILDDWPTNLVKLSCEAGA